MPLVAGIDSSTQSVKVVVCDAETGEVRRRGRAAHPDGTECPPEAWWSALEDASEGLLEGVAAISVAGQQHGMVVLDDQGDPVRPALLWNDGRSAPQAAQLINELGGPTAWADAVGSVPVPAFTVTKLRWLAEHEPAAAARTATVLLPHDYLTWRLAGRPAEPVTDRGDASGTGYWSAARGEYRDDLLELAFGRRPNVPRVALPAEAVGETARGALLAPGTGDNMAAALGIGARAGDVMISLGTSGTAFAQSNVPSADPTGLVAGFADATGEFLPLVCTQNAALVLVAMARLLGTDLAGLSELALAAPAGSEGLVLLPYLDGERAPILPDAHGSLHGIAWDNLTPSNMARAAIEGVVCGLSVAVEALVGTGVRVDRLLLLGGVAASTAVQAVAAGVFSYPVYLPPPDEYVANGAARQAAWVLGRRGELPGWSIGPTPLLDGEPVPVVRAAYDEAFNQLYG